MSFTISLIRLNSRELASSMRRLLAPEVSEDALETPPAATRPHEHAALHHELGQSTLLRKVDFPPRWPGDHHEPLALPLCRCHHRSCCAERAGCRPERRSRPPRCHRTENTRFPARRGGREGSGRRVEASSARSVRRSQDVVRRLGQALATALTAARIRAGRRRVVIRSSPARCARTAHSHRSRQPAARQLTV